MVPLTDAEHAVIRDNVAPYLKELAQGVQSKAAVSCTGANGWPSWLR